MQKLNDYIEEKKIKSSKTPRYGMKKLAVGLVSCILGYTVLVSPSVAHAEEVREPEAVVMQAEEEEKEEAVLSEETEEGEEAVEEQAEEETSEEVVEESALQVSEGEKEAVIAAETKEEVTEETLGSQEDTEEEVVDEEETAEEAEEEETEEDEEDGINIEDAELISNVLGLSEENVGEAVGQGEETAEATEKLVFTDKQAISLEEVGYSKEEITNFSTEVNEKLKNNSSFNIDEYIKSKRDEMIKTFESGEDVSNTIIDKRVHLNTEKLISDENARIEKENEERKKYNKGKTKANQVELLPFVTGDKANIYPDQGDALGWEVSFTSPKGTKAGDYFIINLSDNLSLKGIEPYHESEYPIRVNDSIVAYGVRNGVNEIKYTFNKNVNDLRNVRVALNGYAYVDKTKVPNTTDKEFSIAVGDTKDEDTIKVDYGKDYETGNLNGKSQITQFDPEKGTFTQVFYINPEGKTIKNSTASLGAINTNGKVALIIDGKDKSGKDSDVNFTNDNTKVTVIKVGQGKNLPDAIIENPVDSSEKAKVTTKIKDGAIEIIFSNQLGTDGLPTNGIQSSFVVTVQSQIPTKTDVNAINLLSKGTLYGDKDLKHIMDNNIVTTEGGTSGEGQQVGYFEEHHIYYTKVDDVLQEDKTFTVHSSKTEGFGYDNYFTSKNEIDDFKFVRVDTDNLVANPTYNADGSLARGGYEVGKTKEVTYIYVRDIKHGTFQEHHIYQIYKDGELQENQTDTINLEETNGIDEDTFKTSAKANGTNENQKVGFKLEKEENSNKNHIVKSDKITSDLTGAEKTLNYINDTKLEVTYYYRKDITTKGSFTEHHVYEVYKDGVKQEDKTTKIDIAKTEGPEKDKFTTSAKPNGTEEKPKTGFTLVPEEITKSPEITADVTGAEVTPNYINEKDLEVKYVYRKDITTKGSFKEKHIYKVYKDGVLQENQTSEIEITTDTNGKTFEGTEKETFKTSAKPEGIEGNKKEGFKLVPEEIKKSIAIDKTLGTEQVEFHYIDKNELQAVYVYRKDITSEESTKPQPEPTPDPNPNPEPDPEIVIEDPVEKTGEFQEHHIYIVKDKDGNEIRREEVHEDIQKGKKTDKYITEKKEKDGFKFIKTQDPKNNPVYNEDGSKAEGNFEEDIKKEITYVYEKIEESITPTPEETPVEEPKEDPAPKHEEEKPEPKEEPKTEEPKEEETPEETHVEEPKEEEKEVVIEKEEDDEADRSNDTTHKHEGKEDYSKAPQTGVAGAAGYLGLAGLGTALLAALEDKKKKKNK